MHEIEIEIEEIMEAVERHQELYRNALPLIASENVTSEDVRILLASDLSHRYAEGEVGARFYQGCEYIDAIEGRAIKWARELFRAEHVNLKPVSGVNANIAALFALTSPGDRMMALSVPDGGHISHSAYSVPGLRGLKLERIPFDPKEMNIDIDRAERAIRATKPKLILLGASLFLFPHPIRELLTAADEVDATLLYDASHVLGLIAGNRFQDPLREGADVVTSSTHKTFPGPQGALILCKGALSDRIDRAVFPGTVSNHHLHHIAGLAVALREMMHFGEAYAAQIQSNAKALAQALYEAGFNVLCEHKGFTESHQIAIDVRGLGGGARVAKRLEEAYIITNKNMLPFDKEPDSPSGIRLGVQELTRTGMKEPEMIEIASLMRRLLIEEEPATKVRNDVMALKEEFQNVHYSFDGGLAYRNPASRNKNKNK